jgi:hypothetical protein
MPRDNQDDRPSPEAEDAAEGRPGYGRDEWGMAEQSDWRGPGEMAGYRENGESTRARGFSQGTSGGQAPGEFREWGRRGDRGERRVGGEPSR